MQIRITGWILFTFVSLVMASSTDANTIGGGADHTVVIKPDGTVWAWGENTYGQLGDGTQVPHPVPAQVNTLTDVTAIAVGASHTLALKSDGTVWAWGNNANGQLGDGTQTLRKDPIQVGSLTSVIAIAAGDQHSVALTSGGRVWTWGKNTNGQLGDGSTTLSKQPVMLTGLTSMTAIGAGASHTLAVKNDGTVCAWGLNTNGQLGDNSTTQRTSPVTVTSVTGASAVSGGASHSVILKSDGTLRAMGLNTSGQLGDSSNTQRTTSVAVSTLTSVTAIATGALSSYALKSDGTVWAWGSNGSGRLGDGTTTNRNAPTQASVLSSIGLVGAGTEHGIAVTSAGVVWTWGSNDSGELGDGTAANRSTPAPISGTNYDWKVGTPVFSVASGSYTTEKTVVVTCATPDAVIHYTLDGVDPTESDPTVTSGSSLTVDQTRTLKARAWKTGMPASDVASAVYTLSVAALTFSPSATTYTTAQTVSISTTSPGATIYYTLDGSTPTVSSPVYSGSFVVGTTTTVSAIGVRSGWTSSAVKTGTYTMNFGTLEAPAFSPAPGTYNNDVTLTLTAMSGATIRTMIAPQNVTSSSPAYTAPIVIGASTTINARAYHPDYTTSVQVPGAYSFVVATPTLSHIGGTYPAGHVITPSTATVGAVMRYTLNGSTPTASDPIVPAGGIVAGNFTLKVAAWKTGYTASGVVTATYQVTGAITPPLVAAGDGHSLAIRADGTLWSWGGNGSRQLGDGTTTSRNLPILVNVSGGVALAAGASHSLTLRADGSITAWGANGNGQLGNGTTNAGTTPGPVSGLFNVVAIAAGGSHSLALLNTGAVWSWGRNSEGQLGDGTTTQRLDPVQAPELSSITRLAAGSNHSLALKADGSVWTWGANGNGQLGIGNTTARSTPGALSGLAATQIAAGNFHSLVLLADGTVRAWGSNVSGQLGDGSNTQRTTPVTVTGLASITAIAGGGSHSLALDSSGVVWAWGSNANGQLGDGSTTNRNTAATVAGLPAIVWIAAGGYHSLAIDADGGVWAWGRNTDGQLGDATTTNRLAPVQIATAGMVWKIPAPVLSLPTGLYTAIQSVTVTSGDAEAVLHYTTTGANPLETDPVVASGGALSITQSTTLKVRAWKPGAVASEVTTGVYELKTVAPVLTPGTGQYGSAQSVSMTTATSGATIRYTTDGSEPNATSSVYSASITVSDVRTVKARTFLTGWTTSDSTAASYVIYGGAVATPTITPAAGAFTATPLVTLATTTTGATIRYTTDGSEPTVLSTIYAFPFLIERTTTVKARGFAVGPDAEHDGKRDVFDGSHWADDSPGDHAGWWVVRYQANGHNQRAAWCDAALHHDRD
jgi:alpha-tubulin suppressor-like RCC1 family protein